MTITTEIRKSRWTGERIARLGFLLGLGWDAKRIAEDPIISSTPNNVHRQAQRFGLAFRAAAAAMSLRLRIPSAYLQSRRTMASSAMTAEPRLRGSRPLRMILLSASHALDAAQSCVTSI